MVCMPCHVGYGCHAYAILPTYLPTYHVGYSIGQLAYYIGTLCTWYASDVVLQGVLLITGVHGATLTGHVDHRLTLKSVPCV
jgi:hypothetical protein